MSIRFCAIACLLIFSSFIFSQDETITGEYCYTYGDDETLVKAKARTRDLAIINAIKSYRVYVESITEVQDFQLTNDEILAISKGKIRNVETVRNTENNRTICITIRGQVNRVEIENALKVEIDRQKRRQPDPGDRRTGPQKYRAVPLNDLNHTGLWIMLQKHGFYCENNPNGPGIENEFVKIANGVAVIDYSTGLMWEQLGAKFRFWDQVDEYIQDLNRYELAEYSDWRLPTLEEALTLVEPDTNESGLHISSIFNNSIDSVWTADGSGRSPSTGKIIWIVDFKSASIDTRSEKYYKRFGHYISDYPRERRYDVRAVRSLNPPEKE